MRVRSAVDEPPQVVVHGGEYRQRDGHPCGTENQESSTKILKKKKKPSALFVKGKKQMEGAGGERILISMLENPTYFVEKTLRRISLIDNGK